MENLVKRISSNTTALITLILIVLSAASLFIFKLNTGPDFHDSTAVRIQVDHETPTDNVTAYADSILPPSRVLKESTGTFHLYYQNISPEQLTDLTTRLKEIVPGILSAKAYNITTAGEVLLATRVMFVAFSGLIAYLIYVAITFKKFEFSRGSILQLLTGELFILAFSTIVLLGLGSLLGKLGLVMNTVYWVLFLSAVAVVLVFRAYSIFRLRDFAEKEISKNFALHYEKMYQKYWPEFVFIFCLGIIVTLLPWLVSGKEFVLAAILIFAGCALAFFNFSLLQPHFLNFVSELQLANNKTTKQQKNKKISFWSKTW